MSQPAPRDPRRVGTPPPASSPPDAPLAPATPPNPAARRRPLLLVLLSVLGPGVVSAAAGNDAGGITTFSQVGANYGYSLLWGLADVTVGLIVVQEMCARMGAVTGKGLADLIRENFGVKITAFAMLVLVIANFAITVSEFAGIAAVGEMYLPNARYYIVPASALLVWLLVSRGSYQRVERIFLVASLVFFTYVVTALKIGVPWKHVAQATFAPHLAALPWGPPLIVMLVTLIGTTISPYMQFYQQAAVRDKGITIRDYALAKWDTIIGCVLSSIVAAFIVITCAGTLFKTGPPLDSSSSAADVALALAPLAGKLGEALFAFGLLNASLMAAVIVPLSTAYAVTESLGWASGLGQRIRELPLFYGTYGAMIALSAGLIMLLPAKSSLISLILSAQIVNCALLPVELVLILILINRRRVMGRYRNRLGLNIIAWVTTVVAAALSLFLLGSQIWNAVHPG